jgi:hypothetical protein
MANKKKAKAAEEVSVPVIEAPVVEQPVEPTISVKPPCVCATCKQKAAVLPGQVIR